MSRDNAEDVGNKVILPYMTETSEDGMSFVRKFGKPDLFITITSNRKWKEITEALYLDKDHKEIQHHCKSFQNEIEKTYENDFNG